MLGSPSGLWTTNLRCRSVEGGFVQRDKSREVYTQRKSRVAVCVITDNKQTMIAGIFVWENMYGCRCKVVRCAGLQV